METFRLGSFSRTNDPKESKDWEFNLATYQNRDLGAYNFKQISALCCVEVHYEIGLRLLIDPSYRRDIFNRGLTKPRM